MKDRRSVEMYGRTSLLILLLLCLPYILSAQKDTIQTGKIIITFTDIRSDIGNIVMGLYTAENQWTNDPHYSFSWDKKYFDNGIITVEIDSLPRNSYACAVLDDEDESSSMKYFCGLPKEGWGMSSNPAFLKLKTPSFKDVSFELDCPAVRIEIKMNYLNRNKNRQTK